ncbi:MAG: hypothetical protein P1U89_21040 [Verrucomicrobiales bacterium]|nr:hypothetical protein [Verrucomicrobiales bacterium]
MKKVAIIIGGILFGSGLAISGMTNPGKVIGFLDIFGNWDPALAFVMGGALAVYGLGLLVIRRTRPSLQLPDTTADPVSKRMAIGSAIFGIGWGLGGFCPGPAIANLATLRYEVIWFVPMMLIGMFLAQRIFRLDT